MALAVLGCAAPAQAVTLAVSPTTATGTSGGGTTPTTLGIAYLGDSRVVALQADLMFPTAKLSVSSISQRDSLCAADNALGRVRIVKFAATALPSEQLCGIRFAVKPAAIPGEQIALDLRNAQFLDSSGQPAAGQHSLTDGLIAIQVPQPPLPRGPFAYIANQHADTVSVIDLASGAVTASLAVGDTPYGLAVSALGDRVYAANFFANSISVIDTAGPTLRATIAAGNGPYGMAVHPDGRELYVGHRFGNQLWIIDTLTLQTLATLAVPGTPIGVVVHPRGHRLYVARSASDDVAVIDLRTRSQIAAIAVGNQPGGLALAPDGGKLYVANYLDASVSVVDTASHALLATIPLVNNPQFPVSNPFGIAVRQDGAFVYVVNQGTGNVSVINAATRIAVATVSVGGRPAGVSIGPWRVGDDGVASLPPRVYVTNETTDAVTVISSADNTVQATLPAGDGAASFGQFIGRAPLDRAVVALTPAANADSIAAVSSASGRHVVFQSRASSLVVRKTVSPDGRRGFQLVPQGAAGDFQVYLLDTLVGAVQRVSVDSAGMPSSGPALEPSISADGALVAFVAGAASMPVLTGESAAKRSQRLKASPYSVFLRNLLTDETTPVGPAAPTADGSGSAPLLSPDGDFLLYAGLDPALAKGAPGVQTYKVPLQRVGDAVTIRDDLAACESCMAVGSNGLVTSTAVDGESSDMVISADGRWLAWETTASHAALSTACPNAASDILLRNLLTGITRRVGVPPSAGQCAAGGSRGPKLDYAGSQLVFESDHALKPGDANGSSDVYLYDLLTGSTTRVSETPAGGDALGASSQVSLSGDGSTLAFVSLAGNLDPGSESAIARADVFLYDKRSAALRRMKYAATGTIVEDDSFRPALDYNGTALLFDSPAGNLDPASTAGVFSIYRRDNPLRADVVFAAGFD